MKCVACWQFPRARETTKSLTAWAHCCLSVDTATTRATGCVRSGRGVAGAAQGSRRGVESRDLPSLGDSCVRLATSLSTSDYIAVRSRSSVHTAGNAVYCDVPQLWRRCRECTCRPRRNARAWGVVDRRDARALCVFVTQLLVQHQLQRHSSRPHPLRGEAPAVPALHVCTL